MGDWREVQNISLPSLGQTMTVGLAWGKLMNLWKKYHMLQRKGEYRDDVAYQINKVAVALDLGRVDLPELADMPDSEFEGPSNQTLESEEIPGEDPLYRTLRHQEQEAEREQKGGLAQAETEQEAEDDWFTSSEEEVEDLWPDY